MGLKHPQKVEAVKGTCLRAHNLPSAASACPNASLRSPLSTSLLKYERRMGCVALGKLLTLSELSHQCQDSHGFLRGSPEPQAPDRDYG